MAKETKIHPFFLFLSTALLASAAWWMASFPLLGFVAFAPIFALTDRIAETSSVWEKMEWVLLALTLSFFASHHFDTSLIAISMLEGILFTLPFVGHVWIRQTLGPKAGKITILLFWLSLEYLLLKTRPAESTYLADMLKLKNNWTQWSVNTGYLGSSLWLLLTNLFVYQATLSKTPFHWSWITAAVLALAAPLGYSFYLTDQGISREMMINLYSQNNSNGTAAAYLAQGEWIVRTAAWISTLVLLFTLVKNKIHR